MAKKKANKTGKKKGSSRKSGGAMGFDLTKIGGIAGGVFAGKKLDELEMLSTWDPKMKAVAKIALGEFGQKQSFVRNAIKNDNLLRGVGDGLIAQGATELMTEMGFIQGDNSALEDDDELVVVIDGVDDLDVVNEDVLGDDDDLDVVNEDVLGDDDDDDDDDNDDYDA